jgi:hypothetical protein
LVYHLSAEGKIIQIWRTGMMKTLLFSKYNMLSKY